MQKVSLKIEGSESTDDLMEAYKECKDDINKYPSLKGMFTSKKVALEKNNA